MTESNIFCYSKQFNDDQSFQQKRWRAFNQEVSETRYWEIVELTKSIIPNENKLKLTDFWKSITQTQWDKLLEIPEAKDFKEGFEYISGVKINEKSKETIRIGEVEFDKAEVESRLKGLKPVK